MTLNQPLTVQDLERMLRWSEPTPRTTVRGPQVVRTAPPTNEFWGLWRSRQGEVRALGMNPLLDNKTNTWYVIWYQAQPKVSIKLDLTKSVEPVKLAPSNGVSWSLEQQAIFAWFKSSISKALVIRARAGTGKTTTIKVAFTHALEGRMLYLVFNKKNQREAVNAISDPRVDIKTLHSLGLLFIQQVWAGVKPTDEVEVERVELVVGANAPKEVKQQVKKLVGFAKNMTINPTLEELVELAEVRDIEAPAFEQEENGGWNVTKLAKAALGVLEKSKERDPEGRISFNDMVWLPIAMNWTRAWFDLVVVDEAQDMNLPQLLMAKASVKPGGRIVVVGDDRQAIYGFRGAASDGMDMMKRELAAEELGLTITYRCPKSVVALAKTIVTDYQSAPTAPEGLVEELSGQQVVLNQAKIGDVVLSRSNAPLMPLCLALLRKGMPARIEGKDIGKMLLGIVDRLNAKTVPQFITKVESWGEKQKNRYSNSKHFEEKSQEINDQVDMLQAVADGASSVLEIRNRLANLFKDSDDETAKPSVVLSSTHKAKGLEWEKVFMLRDTFNRKPPVNAAPVPPEIAAARIKEEQNIYYVALTRAKKHLVLVSGKF